MTLLYDQRLKTRGAHHLLEMPRMPSGRINVISTPRLISTLTSQLISWLRPRRAVLIAFDGNITPNTALYFSLPEWGSLAPLMK